MRLKPITLDRAIPEIRYLFEEIKDTLHVTFVPLLFQILANFPEYFLYLWQRIEANLGSTPFEGAYPEIITFAAKAMSEIYIPSSPMSELVCQLNPVEKEHIKKTAVDLAEINAKLLILAIAVRESIKGLAVGAPKLAEKIREQEKKEVTASIFDEFVKERGEPFGSNIPLEIQQAGKMLVPLTGSRALVVSDYPMFFTYISKEMERLMKIDEYLRRRVLLERLCLSLIDRLTVPLGSSYKEFLDYTYDKTGSDELAYLLTDAFPSQFPHLVFTSAVIEQALVYKNMGVIVRTDDTK